MQLTRWLQVAFLATVQQESERCGSEMQTEQMWNLFKTKYAQLQTPYKLAHYAIQHAGQDKLDAQLQFGQANVAITGRGDGALTAFANALKQHFDIEFEVVNYSEHALTKGTNSDAIAYLQIQYQQQQIIGVAINSDILTATLNALLSAVNQIAVVQTTTINSPSMAV